MDHFLCLYLYDNHLTLQCWRSYPCRILIKGYELANKSSRRIDLLLDSSLFSNTTDEVDPKLKHEDRTILNHMVQL